VTITKKSLCTIPIIIALLIPIRVSVWAQQKIVTAKKVNPKPPIIDGHGEDPVWMKTEWEAGFIQNAPNEGEKPSQESAFKVLYDDENLYVLIRAFDTEPEKIDRRIARRDDPGSDFVDVWIDSYHDHRTAFLFLVTAGGVKTDCISYEDGGYFDMNWDPVWYAITSIDEKGWMAEMKIPFSQLRFGNHQNQVWGLNVERGIHRLNEWSRWKLIPTETKGFASLFGELHGITGIPSSRRIEFLPYFLGSYDHLKKEVGNPFEPGQQKSLLGGLDGKIGITSDLTLDFTINPDFGQVEADPSVINLTTFETFFEEKRPFFIEGRNIFNFNITNLGNFSRDNLFYSRRIGRLPQHDPEIEDEAFADVPDKTSIIGAAKLTGKTKDGLSVGILESITQHEKAEIDLLGQRRLESVEPMTNYCIGRIQKDFQEGKTILGGMVTAVNRQINTPELDFIPRSAYTGGLDFLQYFKNKEYNLTAKTIFSHIRGSQEAMIEVQESPVRYFQRPDADYVAVDSGRTSVSGHGGTLEFGKCGGGHIRYLANLSWRSPGLELNDLGYLRSADVLKAWLQAGYVTWKPFSIFRNFSAHINLWKNWDFGGHVINQGAHTDFNLGFKNNWHLFLHLRGETQSLSPYELQGGPSIILPGMWTLISRLETDQSKKIQFNTMVLYTNGEDRYFEDFWFMFGTRYRPYNALEISINPFIEIYKNNLKYVTSEDVDLDKRYICAALDQKTVSLTFRLNVCLTPELSIQYYGQPFLSSGRYTNFKKVTDPRAHRFQGRYSLYEMDQMEYNDEDEEIGIDENRDGTSDYTIDNPDFTFMRFNSNLVIRWEYSPGSTVYAVWSQRRTEDTSHGEFSFRNGMHDLFHLHPHDVFLIKFNHWFSL